MIAYGGKVYEAIESLVDEAVNNQTQVISGLIVGFYASDDGRIVDDIADFVIHFQRSRIGVANHLGTQPHDARAARAVTDDQVGSAQFSALRHDTGAAAGANNDIAIRQRASKSAEDLCSFHHDLSPDLRIYPHEIFAQNLLRFRFVIAALQ